MRCKKFIIIFLVLVFIAIFCISFYIILKDMKERNENDESTENLIEESIEINEESQEKEIDSLYSK